jgi:hypothetical protein
MAIGVGEGLELAAGIVGIVDCLIIGIGDPAQSPVEVILGPSLIPLAINDQHPDENIEIDISPF